MDKLVEEVLDCVLLFAQSYLLLRIAMSKTDYFRTPFFVFFLTTGAFGSLSVVGFIIAVRFPIPEERAFIFKIGSPQIWSHRLNAILIGIQILLSLVRCISIFFCGYAFAIRDGVKIVTYVDDDCTVVDKTQSSVINFIYIIISVVLTALTSRLMYKLQQESGSLMRQLIVQHQRNMFIVVSSCAFSHFLKAIHQLCWVFVAYFHLSDFDALLQRTYVYSHYLATYSASITLVILSPRVRKLLFCKNSVEDRAADATIVVN